MIIAINQAPGFTDTNLPVTITGLNFNKPLVNLNQGSLMKVATATTGKRSTATPLYVTLLLTGISGGLNNITVQNSDGVNTTGTDIFYVTGQA